jgi:hypothetical protein
MPAPVVWKPDPGTHGLTASQYKLLAVCDICFRRHGRRHHLLEMLLLLFLTTHCHRFLTVAASHYYGFATSRYFPAAQ